MPICSFAISSVPIINCLWTQYPKSKNKAMAVAVICFGVGGVIWNYFFTKLVNPQNETTTVIDPVTGMSFFSLTVANKSVEALRIIFLLCGLLFVFGAFLVKKDENYKDRDSSSVTEI